MINLEEARSGIVALRLLFNDQELLDRLRFANVAHRLEKVLATVDVKLFRQRGKHAAEHHVAGSGATRIFLLLEDFQGLRNADD